jgi:phosphoglycolate phosphatase
MAVASNKYQTATEKIVNHFFPNTFDIVLGERENVPRKPNPQIVWDILSNLTEQSDIIYIGDSLVDAETAKAAGATLVLCTWGFCTEEQLKTANPNYMINHPSELLNIV